MTVSQNARIIQPSIPPARPRRTPHWPAAATTAAALLLIVAYCLLRYGDAAREFFFLDDFWLLRDAARVQVETVANLAQIFRPSHAGYTLYRPLTQVGYFVALRHLFGIDSGAYHAAQLAVFAFNVVLVFAIARRLSASALGGLVAALLYAAAPGHAVAVFWLAAFTITGTATATFALLWWWLRATGRRRAIGCALLQTIALLASEHAVVGPALLALCAVYAPRERGRAALRDLAPTALIVALYLALKLAGVSLTKPLPGYAISWDASRIVNQIGAYAIACLNAAALLAPAAQHVWVGAAVLAFTAWSNAQALRGAAAWRLPALGSALWLVSLAPVLALTDHYYDYFVGIAALGFALAAVGLCMLAGRHWRVVALGLVVAVLTIDPATGERAARGTPVFALVRNAAASSARWLVAVEDNARATAASTVLVPKNNTTAMLFGTHGAAAVFFPAGPRVELYPPGRLPAPAPGAVALLPGEPRMLPPDRPLPGWEARWNALRAIVMAPRSLLERLASAWRSTSSGARRRARRTAAGWPGEKRRDGARATNRPLGRLGRLPSVVEPILPTSRAARLIACAVPLCHP